MIWMRRPSGVSSTLIWLRNARSVGDALRGSLESDPDLTQLAGLADGVVSRVRAEDRESWRGKFARATGWTPTVALDDGLRKTVAFYRANLAQYL